MKTNLKKLGALVGFFWLLAMSGCCRPVESNTPPPAQVKGWQTVQVRGKDPIGEFVLKKGESVENQTIGIELVDVAPGENCWYKEWRNDGAVVRIFRVSDKQTIRQIDSTMGVPNRSIDNES